MSQNSDASGAARRYAPLYVGLLLTFLLCVGFHEAALGKLEVNDTFGRLSERISRNRALVALLDGHPALGVGYFLFSAGIVAFSAWRRYPLWACWAAWLLLMAPCFVYVLACTYLLGRPILL